VGKEKKRWEKLGTGRGGFFIGAESGLSLCAIKQEALGHKWNGAPGLGRKEKSLRALDIRS